MKLSFLAALSVLAFPCYAGPDMPERWQMFCTPDEERCYPSETNNDDLGTQENDFDFLFNTPPFTDTQRLTLKTFVAEGVGTITQVIDVNTFALSPSDGTNGRLFRLVSPHQERFTLHEKYDRSILVQLPSTAPFNFSSTQDTSTSINRVRQLFKSSIVNYKCYGLYHSGAASCYLATNTNRDLGEHIIASGLARPYALHPKRYESAFDYAYRRNLGAHSNHTLSQALYPMVRKDRFNVCWHTLDRNLDDDHFYVYFENMDLCLQSGGIRGDQP